MRFENEFEVEGSVENAIQAFADVPLVASLLPGASVGPVNPDGSYPATLVVSFGPKRLAFKGTITNHVDMASHSGVMSGTASADVRGAKMAVNMKYRLAQCETQLPARAKVSLVSEAQLTGVLAEFAKTGGIVVTNALLTEFARNFSAQFALREQPSPASAASPTLSASFLIAATFRSILAKFRARLSQIVRRRPTL